MEKKLDANNMDGLIDPSNHLCYFFQLKMVTFFLILAILLQFSPVLFFFRLKTNTDYVVVFFRCCLWLSMKWNGQKRKKFSIKRYTFVH